MSITKNTKDSALPADKLEQLRIEDMSGVGFWIAGPVAAILVLHGIMTDLTLHPKIWDLSWLYARLGVLPICALSMYALRSKWRDRFADISVLAVGIYIACVLAYIIARTGLVDSNLTHGFIQIVLGAAVIPIKPRSFALSIALVFSINIATVLALGPNKSLFEFARIHLINIESYGVLSIIVFYTIYRTRKAGYTATIKLEDELQERQAKIDRLVKSEVSAKEIELKISIGQQVAHDIRSPLTAVTTILKQKDLSNAAVQNLLRETINRISSIASDLLKEPARPLSTDLYQDSSDLTQSLKNLILQKRIELGLDETSLSIFFETDSILPDLEPQKIERVLSNFINNAFDAIPKQGGRIEVSIGRSGSNIWLSVSDNGSGISKEVRSRLGHRGFTTKRGNVSTGSGLGLYSAISIIKERNGTIEFNNNTNGGTIVRATWPIQNL